MQVEQFVMAYGVEQDRLRALLPEGYSSLRPVLRLNAEIYDGGRGYLEYNTAVERDGVRGWLNIGAWKDVAVARSGAEVCFRTDFLEIRFAPVGIEGSCPAEKDNAGCFFPGRTPQLRPPEQICVKKEFCDCTFAWHFAEGDAHGQSTGRTLPAVPAPVRTVYPGRECTPQNAAAIPCEQVLGAYVVRFAREG